MALAQPFRRSIRGSGEDPELDALGPEIQGSILSALLQDQRPDASHGMSNAVRAKNAAREVQNGLRPSGGVSRPPLPSAGASVLSREGRPRSGDDSLLSSMASRLAQVEQQNRQLTARLKKQHAEMDELREQLAARRHAASPGSEESVLQVECDRLRSQVEEMKQFMADYGLNWPPRSAAQTGLAVDFQVIESRIETLNDSLGREAKVVHENGGGAKLCARLRSVETLPLTFFCDGLKLGPHGFMAFQTAAAQDVIRDLLDGFIPRLLKEDYPDGVALKAVNRTKLSFRNWLKESQDSELVDGGERLRTEVGQAVHAPKDLQSASERFVAKLPERIMRKGQVCQVRSAIAQRLGVSDGRSASAPPPGNQEVSLLALGRPADAPVARLQVKLEGGQKVLLKTEFHTTLGDLWEALADWRSKNRVGRARSGCVLRTAFPPKSYTDRSQTLQDAGLTPSATLFVGYEDSQPSEV
eukprot:s734_g7.t1